MTEIKIEKWWQKIINYVDFSKLTTINGIYINGTNLLEFKIENLLVYTMILK